MITLVFTDVVESSATKRHASLGGDDRARDRAYLVKIQTHHYRLVREAIAATGGKEISTHGDSFFITFEGPAEAVRCAVDVQRKLAEDPIETPRGPLQVRIGIHTGDPEYFEESWHGTDVDLAARTQAAAGSGQILMTAATHKLIAAERDVRLRNMGLYALKGVQPIELWEADWDGKGPRRTAALSVAVLHRRKLMRLGTYALGILMVAGGWLWNYRPLKARRSIAVIGFKSLSAKPETAWVSTALAEMFNLELSLGEKLRAIPGESVARMKVDLALPDTASFGRETIEKIRQNLGVNAVVTGTYLDQMGQIRLDLVAQDTEGFETIAAVTASGSEAELGALVSKAGGQLRAKLGIEAISERDLARIRAATSSSPEATRLHAEGLRKLRAFDLLGAKDDLENAVAADPGFALAHSALSAAWSKLGYSMKARDEARRAFELSSDLPDQDRLEIEGQYWVASADYPRAIEAFGKLFRAKKDSLDFGLLLADAQMRGGKAKETWETLVELRKLPASAKDDPRIDLAESKAAYEFADYDRESAAAQRARGKAMAIGARRLLADAQMMEGLADRARGRHQEARKSLESARQLYEAGGDRSGVGGAYHQIAVSFTQQQDLTAAEALEKLALAIAREIGNRQLEADTETGLGSLSSQRGDSAAALKHQSAAVRIYRENSDFLSVSQLLKNSGYEVYRMGRLGESQTMFEEAIKTGNRRTMAFSLNNLGQIQRARGELSAARGRFEESVAICRQMGAPNLEYWFRINLAGLALEQGRTAEAVKLSREGRDFFIQSKDKERQLLAESVLAAALIAGGKAGEAREMLHNSAATAAKAKTYDFRAAYFATAARVAAEGLPKPDEAAAAIRNLEMIVAEGAKHAEVPFSFEARLAMGEVEMKCGRQAAGRTRLEALQREAKEKGFTAIAAKAQTALKPAKDKEGHD